MNFTAFFRADLVFEKICACAWNSGPMDGRDQLSAGLQVIPRARQAAEKAAESFLVSRLTARLDALTAHGFDSQ